MLDPKGGLKILKDQGQPPFIPCRVPTQKMKSALPEKLQKLVEVRVKQEDRYGEEGAVLLGFYFMRNHGARLYSPAARRTADGPFRSHAQETLKDRNVIRSIWLSIYTAMSAAGISFIVGTPLAYVLARSQFRGKHFIESIIDLPIVIPSSRGRHRDSECGRKEPLAWPFHAGNRNQDHGQYDRHHHRAHLCGMPFYINALKSGFEAISPRLENVSRSLGASMWSTFIRITFPLAWRSVLVGLIMCCARSISEFGAVVVVAYHP
jgi:ABC-type glycerol-3-phosphate transport system permease component